ncbi:GNAT family protein [Streptococcus pluranimalium]|uniref:GNAT family N-acetyltransferase n=1 Tax=Streptococcus pluranimalium TaxID=82348 RepID=UPI0024151767|nr:GNAT family protein [Streptococcus pluranimalium]WFM80272.1 GNAT family protein [Streptococcus pluranimalium]HEM6116115.1 GNAT family N-acetyltransferase [Streptococcus suis]
MTTHHEKLEKNGLPILETKRLYLRERTVADAEAVFAYASLPEVTWPAGFPPVKTVEDEVYYLEQVLPKRNADQDLPAGYGICLKGTDNVIGSVDFNYRYADDVLEMGYVLHPDYWQQGIMTEACQAFLEAGFTRLNLHKIEISCFDYNQASRKLAEKLGFALEATVRDRKDAQGNRCADLRYGLLRSEWKKLRT